MSVLLSCTLLRLLPALLQFWTGHEVFGGAAGLPLSSLVSALQSVCCSAATNGVGSPREVLLGQRAK